MGAAPSRETHRRGLFVVPQCPHSKKQDIVMIPLTREFFPSPDCPLFVQFHNARCSAAVNYYFRRPGNPGDLSHIPDYADAYREEDDGRGETSQKGAAATTPSQVSRDGPPAGKKVEQTAPSVDFYSSPTEEGMDAKETADSYPSREAFYRGVIESIEETLFDTDQEMREAYVRERAHTYDEHGSFGGKPRRVLPVMCAVAFRHEIGKAPAPVELSSPTLSVTHSAFGGGVSMGNYLVNIVGCFGFVPVQDEVDAAQQEGLSRLVTPLVSSMPQPPPGSRANSECSSCSLGTSLQSIMKTGGQSLVDYPSQMENNGAYKGLLMTLPASAAAPLAAMVFLTKSAGEQKLAHVTYVAASTYYFQLIKAGVISRRSSFPCAGGLGSASGFGSPVGSEGLPPLPYPPPPPPPPPPGAAPFMPVHAASCRGGSTPMPELPPPAYLPPMEMFSFSSLITNIPVLAFLYEMKCRWGYLGVLRSGTPTAAGRSTPCSPNGSTLSRHALSSAGGAGGDRVYPSGGVRREVARWGMGLHSSGGLALVAAGSGQNVTDEMEMWITPDQMLHGRISSDLASRLCWSLVERPEVIQDRVQQLPSEEAGYWRYRGLVDRAHPPPLPGPLMPIDPKDVYVMGSDVLPGFDEGDILRLDTVRRVWYADHSIPLEGVVLAAMRSHCKRARESDPQDPGWVTRLVPVDEEAKAMCGAAGGGSGITFPVPPPTPEQAAVMEANPGRYKLVHESMGNFFVYSFKRDGTTYYHGTVPDFANPNKKHHSSVTSLDLHVPNSMLDLPSLTLPTASVNCDKSPVKKINHTPGTSAEMPVAASSRKVGASSPTSGQARKSILNALFFQSHTTEDCSGADPVLASSPKIGTPTTSYDSMNNSFARSASRPDYLANRVTSAAIEAARTLMRNLYSYAYNLSTSTTPLAKATNPPETPFLNAASSAVKPPARGDANASPVSVSAAVHPTSGGGGSGLATPVANHSNSALHSASPTRHIRVLSRSEGSLLELSEINEGASQDDARSYDSSLVTQNLKRYTDKGIYVWDWRQATKEVVEDGKKVDT